MAAQNWINNHEDLATAIGYGASVLRGGPVGLVADYAANQLLAAGLSLTGADDAIKVRATNFGENFLSFLHSGEVGGASLANEKVSSSIEDDPGSSARSIVAFGGTILGITSFAAAASRLSRMRAPAAESVGGIRTAEGVLYNGMTGPGPLEPKVAGTFRSGSYTEILTSDTTTLYRAYGGRAGEIGPYWTRTKPSGPVQSMLDSALDPMWGNNATKVVRIDVPRGVRIYDGAAAPQRGLVGGGNQVFVPKVDPSWIVK